MVARILSEIPLPKALLKTPYGGSLWGLCRGLEGPYYWATRLYVYGVVTMAHTSPTLVEVQGWS